MSIWQKKYPIENTTEDNNSFNVNSVLPYHTLKCGWHWRRMLVKAIVTSYVFNRMTMLSDHHKDVVYCSITFYNSTHFQTNYKVAITLKTTPPNGFKRSMATLVLREQFWELQSAPYETNLVTAALRIIGMSTDNVEREFREKFQRERLTQGWSGGYIWSQTGSVLLTIDNPVYLLLHRFHEKNCLLRLFYWAQTQNKHYTINSRTFTLENRGICLCFSSWFEICWRI